MMRSSTSTGIDVGAVQLEAVDTTPMTQRLTRALAAWGMFSLPALAVSVPKGVLPFGIVLLVTTVLMARRMGEGIAPIVRPLSWLSLAVALAIGVALVSSIRLGLDPGDVDNLDRLIAMLWATLWAYVLQPPRAALWWGALVGIAAAFALALGQVLGGAPRASGWGNAIVFADVVLLLMVLAVFCRPRRSWMWTVAALVVGVGAILLSGTRGTWPALLVLLVTLVLGCGWRSRRSRALLLGGLIVAAVAVVMSVPAMREQTRLAELRQDIVRMDRGDNNSSAGARMERLEVATRAFLAHPMTGVGFVHFDLAMTAVPECADPVHAGEERCHLGHAHNDLAEWAATMGIPGVIALLAIYGIPLWLFAQLRRRAEPAGQLRGAANAGLMLVVAFVLCGLTQSMFAHQTTTSVYASLVGLLMGLALREAGVGRTRRQTGLV